MKNTKPTEAELEILNILWQKGACSVRQVHEVIEQTKKSGYTTTLKLMQIMDDKGLVTRDSSAKVHIFKAAVTQKQTQGQLIKKMIDTAFNGSASQMVLQALGNHKASIEELKEIKEYLEKIETKQK